MTSPADRQNDAIALGEFIATLEGKHVKVSQAISWRPGTDFERHSTVHMQFVTLVERTSWAMSGGHFMLYGKDGSSYAVGTTKLEKVQITGGRARILELYGNEAERLSTLEVIDGNAYRHLCSY